MNQVGAGAQSVTDASAVAVKDRFFSFIREFQIQDNRFGADSMTPSTLLG
jgi:hypothetical protein